MSVDDWLDLEHVEQIGTFDTFLDDIKTMEEEDILILAKWLIFDTSVDEQLKLIDRSHKSEEYLNKLDYFLNYVLIIIIQGANLAFKE